MSKAKNKTSNVISFESLRALKAKNEASKASETQRADNCGVNSEALEGLRILGETLATRGAEGKAEFERNKRMLMALIEYNKSKKSKS